MADISNTDDVIDSREVIERIEELEAERGALQEAIQEAEEALIDASEGQPSPAEIAAATQAEGTALAEWIEENGEELAALLKLAEQGESYAADWLHGATLISGTHFRDYAEQLAEDIGAIDPSAGWPLLFIDWEAAAEALKADYTEIDFDGNAYFVN